MKVLHVIPSIDPRDGGPTLAVISMARALEEQGVRVEIATTLALADAPASGASWGEPVERESCAVRFFPRQTKFYKVSMPLRRWVRDHARDYDLVHVHALFSHAPLAAARSARSAGVPCVVRPLGVLNRWGMDNRRGILKRLSFRCIEKPLLDRASAIHFTSRQEQSEAEPLGIRARAVVIPLGFDCPGRGGPQDAQAFVDTHPGSGGRSRILFLSRIHPKKGLEELLDAFALIKSSHPQIMLVIAGDGDHSFVESLKGRAARLGLGTDVLWTGFITGAAKRSALAAADLFVLPSHSENFGLALLEAMAAGLPCVSTPGVALAAEAAELGAVRLANNDAHSIATALRALLDDATARRMLGDRAAAVTAQHYSRSAMGRALADLYRSLATPDRASNR